MKPYLKIETRVCKNCGKPCQQMWEGEKTASSQRLVRVLAQACDNCGLKEKVFGKNVIQTKLYGFNFT